jgi:hypothetical protein
LWSDISHFATVGLAARWGNAPNRDVFQGARFLTPGSPLVGLVGRLRTGSANPWDRIGGSRLIPPGNV